MIPSRNSTCKKKKRWGKEKGGETTWAKMEDKRERIDNCRRLLKNGKMIYQNN